jgi:hypothetical protein
MATSIEKIGNKLVIKFNAKKDPNLDPSFVNFIHHLLISEVETYSLTKNLNILQNTSSFNNEFIMNIIKLFPIQANQMEPSQYEDIMLVMADPEDLKKPFTNDRDEEVIITAHMLTPYDKMGNRLTRIKTVDLIPYNFPIIKLQKAQSFHFRGEIGQGRGYHHTTYKSCLVSYKFENQVSKDPKSSNNPKSPITQEPVETIDDKRNYATITNNNIPETIVLTLEPNGHFPTLREAYQASLQVFEEKLRFTKNLLFQKDATRLLTQYDPNIDNLIDVKMMDPRSETETINNRLASQPYGHMLSTHMKYRLQNLLANQPVLLQKSMTSYVYPHPLDPVMILRIQVPEQAYSKANEIPSSLRLLDETIDNLLETLRKIAPKMA